MWEKERRIIRKGSNFRTMEYYKRQIFQKAGMKNKI